MVDGEPSSSKHRPHVVRRMNDEIDDALQMVDDVLGTDKYRQKRFLEEASDSSCGLDGMSHCWSLNFYPVSIDLSSKANTNIGLYPNYINHKQHLRKPRFHHLKLFSCTNRVIRSKIYFEFVKDLAKIIIQLKLFLNQNKRVCLTMCAVTDCSQTVMGKGEGKGVC